MGHSTTYDFYCIDTSYMFYVSSANLVPVAKTSLRASSNKQYLCYTNMKVSILQDDNSATSPNSHLQLLDHFLFPSPYTISTLIPLTLPLINLSFISSLSFRLFHFPLALDPQLLLKRSSSHQFHTVPPLYVTPLPILVIAATSFR